MNRSLILTASVLSAIALAGCFLRREQPGNEDSRPVPPGLDSAATQQWIASQRSACRGRFVVFADEGGMSRQYDAQPTPGAPRATLRYATSVVSVQCSR